MKSKKNRVTNVKKTCINTLASRLESSFLGRMIYSKGMGGNLLRLAKQHSAALSQEPEHRVAKALWKTLELKSPTLEKFDDTFTRVAGGSAPTFPFATANDYYAWASSHKVVVDIKVPFLAINAADDPVVRDVPMDAGGNGWAVMALTPGGGHLGWFETVGNSGEVARWVKRPVLEWMRVVGEEIVHDLSNGKPVHEVDGYLKYEERDDLGCKEIDGGGVLVVQQSSSGMMQGL